MNFLKFYGLTLSPFLKMNSDIRPRWIDIFIACPASRRANET